MRVQVCGPIVVEDDGRRLEDRAAQPPGAHPVRLPGDQPGPRRCPGPRSSTPCGPPADPRTPRPRSTPCISRLRRALGAERVEGRGNVRLLLDPVSVDVEDADEAICRAESAVALGQWERAWAASLVALFTAERGFLPGEDALWVDQVRRRLEDLHLRALESYGAAALGLGSTELAAARRAGRTLVAEAPLRESGHRLLMRALAAEDNTAEALRVYEQLRCLLRDELGISPSASTQALYDELLS